MHKLMPTLIAGALLAGCVSETPVADANWRKSVENMNQAQTYDAAAASNPPVLAPEVGDGERIKNAIDEYRKDVAKGTADAKQSVVFEVGSN